MIADLTPQTQTPVQAAEATLLAVETLARVEREDRRPSPDERRALAQYPGMGRLALDIFPHTQTHDWKSDRWRQFGTRLQELTTPEDYASLKRSVFTAYYTAPLVMQTLWEALARFGVPPDAHVFEPGCGVLRFAALAPAGTRMTGVELDRVSARIAQALYPQHTVMQGSLATVPLQANTYDAVIGNVPFADLHYPYWDLQCSLHELCVARSLDALKPGGVMALVVTHYLLDRQTSDFRLALAERARFLGAIRLPDETFRAQGTRVVTDLVFFAKRQAPEPMLTPAAWTQSIPLRIEGVDVAFNQRLAEAPAWVLGHVTRTDRQYGREDTYTVARTGDLALQLAERLGHLPTDVWQADQAPVQAQTVSGVAIPKPCGEGSFFVHQRLIYQVQEGVALPATHGTTSLSAVQGKTGMRLAHLIELRDLAQAALWAQHSGQSPEARQTARDALNRSYDRFVLAYGPINKTVVSFSGDTVRRTQPNLVKFAGEGGDPYAMFVMALEVYAEESDTATKAAMLTRDVLPELQPPPEVASAEQALLLALNATGQVDLDLMCESYGQDEATLLAELGELLYLDPTTQRWETADTYLAGNVRQKLRDATAAGPAYARNVQALKEAQPADLPPSKIDANPQAPWIPESDVKDFAYETFEVPVYQRSWALTFAHVASEALWSVQAERFVREGPAAKVTYGTERRDGIMLFEALLNGQLPSVYDTYEADGQERRVLNEEQTVAARDKQRELRDHFRQWLFADQARAERLVRYYNDNVNNMRRQAFDGSHLTFPGLSTHLTLRQHQVDAIWRTLCKGNTLLAQDVGLGKTFIMLISAMKQKQAGLIHKPLFVVPNNMLRQFTREALQAYPNGRYLMATKDDCTPRRRKFLAAKIATGDWDGIIMTHTSFEKLGMSVAYQERYLQTKLEEYERVLESLEGTPHGDKHWHLIKRLEKKKARYEEKLEALLDGDKDDGLVFDELGVDFLYVDEAHVYKNLETPTTMSGVAGVRSDGADRSLDMAMKLDYLHAKRPGRSVVFATATPVSNSITEIFTMMKYLDPEALRARGIDTFDGWAAVFTEMKEQYEIAVDGASIKPRTRLDLINLPELQSLFLDFTDVRTVADVDLPLPTLAGGTPAIVACPMSPLQQAEQEKLVLRYERIRRGGVNRKVDNALSVTGDGRKLGLDPRLLVDTAYSWPQSKIMELCHNVQNLWEGSHATRAAQLIFSDVGVNPTDWGFSVYQEILRILVAWGIPREQIAVMGEANTDAKKFVLFEAVKRGAKRIVLGSTERMGQGTNFQERLLALHHLDAPWTPKAIRQREGRIIRQGNLHYGWGEPVYIFRYVTEGSFDSFMWQAMQVKARIAANILDGSNILRRVEDLGEHEASYAEVKAIASGNPYMIDLAKVEADCQRLGLLKRHHQDRLYDAKRNLSSRPQDIASIRERVTHMDADLATLAAHPDAAQYVMEGEVFEAEATIAKLGEWLVDVMLRRLDAYWEAGTYRGLEFGVHTTAFGGFDVYLRGQYTAHAQLDLRFKRGDAVLRGLHHLVRDYRIDRDRMQREADRMERQLVAAQEQSTQAFAHDVLLSELTALRDELRIALAPGAPPEHRSAEAISAALKHAMRRHVGDDTSLEDVGPSTSQQSVSASLRDRIAARHEGEEHPTLALPSLEDAADETNEVAA